MATDPTDPLPDIEAAIKEEVAGMNRSKRPPVMQFQRADAPSTLPPQPNTGLESPIGEQHLTPVEPTTLPDILDLLINQIMTLDERISVRLTRIERVLGIKG